MHAMQQPTAPSAPRRRLAGLAAALTFVFAASLLTADPAGALPSGPDTRAKVGINAWLDEPTWAYLDRTSDVLISFTTSGSDVRQPTGTLTVTAHEPGAVPEIRTMVGDEGNFYIPIRPTRIGTRHYTVSYSGDAYFKPVSTTKSYVALTGPEIRTALRSGTSSPVLVSQPIRLTATVRTVGGGPMNGTADGPIVFYADGTAVGEGTTSPGSNGWSAVLNLDSLAVGRHRITAALESVIHYFGPGSAPVYVEVTAPASGLPITLRHTVSQDGPDGSWAHSAASVTGTGPGPAPVGYVQFYMDGSQEGLPVKLVKGKAGIDYQPLQPGTHAISAVYLGDTRHRPADLPTRTVTVPEPAK